MTGDPKWAAMRQATLDLFDEPCVVTAGDLQLARGGLSHFRDQLARYGTVWPYLVPEWLAWISYFEHMARYGYAAAQRHHPGEQESEPSQMLAATTRRLAPSNCGAKHGA